MKTHENYDHDAENPKKATDVNPEEAIKRLQSTMDEFDPDTFSGAVEIAESVLTKRELAFLFVKANGEINKMAIKSGAPPQWFKDIVDEHLNSIGFKDEE